MQNGKNKPLELLVTSELAELLVESVRSRREHLSEALHGSKQLLGISERALREKIRKLRDLESYVGLVLTEATKYEAIHARN